MENSVFFARLGKTGKRRWLKINGVLVRKHPTLTRIGCNFILILVIHIRINDMNVTILFVCGTTAGD